MTSHAVPSQRPEGETPFAKVRSKMPNSVLRESDEQQLLRELSVDNSIRRTSSLIAVYNEEKQPNNRAVLHKWLRRYGEKTEHSLQPEAVRDYAELATILPRSSQDEELLKTLLTNLTSCIPDDSYTGKNEGKALYKALLHFPPLVFKDTAQLLSLAEQLLSSLSSSPLMHSSNFKDYEASYLSLRFILRLLETVSRPRLTRIKKDDFRKLLKRKRQELKSSLRHYPVAFHFEHIEHSIDRLTKEDNPPPLKKAFQYATRQLPGGTTIIQCVGSKPRLDTTGLSPAEAIAKIQDAANNLGIRQEQWLIVLQAVTDARMQALRANEKLDAEEKMEVFETGYHTLMKIQQNMKEGENRKALRFGIIHELYQLSFRAFYPGARKRAGKMLVDLSVQCTIGHEWANDADLFEAFLRGIHRIHVKGEQREETEKAIRTLNESYMKDVKEIKNVVVDWLRFSNIEDKLQMIEESGLTYYWQRSLSSEIGSELGYLPLSDFQRHTRDLKRIYDRFDYSKAPALIENGAYKHVKDMQFHVVVYERADETLNTRQSTGIGHYSDHSNGHDAPESKVTREIAVEDLFVPFSHETSEIRKVLVYGPPGSGKTCLSKFIGHQWAHGEILQELKAVYLIPVKKLCSRDNGGRGPPTLERAVMDTCYAGSRDPPLQESLLTHVIDNLNSPKTLLMLDGIDKADEAARAIITDAKGRKCKIILLSRSYGLSGEIFFADREAECLGLSDKQIVDFAEFELPESDAKKFIDDLKSAPALWSLMHIPVMAYILHLLWADNDYTIVDEMGRRNIFSLYTKVVNMLWSRFARRHGMERVLREEVLTKMDSIAFFGFQENQAPIDRTIVEEHASSGVMMGMLRDSGYLFFDVEKDKCHFPHVVFQEYFIGRYLARHLRGESSRDHQNAADFLARRKYERKCKTSLAFMAQVIADRRGTEDVREMFSLIDRGQIEIVGVQHFFLKLQILDEWAAELPESLTDCPWRDGPSFRPIDVAVRVITKLEPGTLLWKLLMDKLEQYRCLLRGFPLVLNVFTEKKKGEDLMGTHFFEGIAKLAKYSPRHLKSFVQIVRNKMESQLPRTRKTGLDMMADLLDHAPQLCRDLLPLLHGRCRDRDEDVRQKVMLVIGRVGKSLPRFATALLPFLKKGCMDPHPAVRMMAMPSIETLLSGKPELSGESLPMLESGTTDADVAVRAMATLMFSRLVKRSSSILGDVLPVFARICGNVMPDVREKTMEVIGDVVATNPGLLVPFHPMLARGCEDVHQDVRKKTMEVIGDVVRTNPYLLVHFERMLARGCEDADEDVRLTAVQVTEAAKAAAQATRELSSYPVRTLCEEPGTNALVRQGEGSGLYASIDAPAQCSQTGPQNDGHPDAGSTSAANDEDDAASDYVKELIVEVIENENDESVRVLLERLFELPVVMEETIKSNRVRLVAARTTRSLGEFEREDVRRLVALLEDCFESEYRGMLPLIRSA